MIAPFWTAAPAAKALVLEETYGLLFTLLFEDLVTLEELASWARIGVEGLATLNAFFQTNELLAFFGGTKELGEETGCALYDDAKALFSSWDLNRG